jgi:hypothetical protein
MKNFLKTLGKRCLIKLNARKQIFVLGDGRSGTTWIAEVLNFDKKYLSLSEPFHGRRIMQLSNDRLYPTRNDLNKLGRRGFNLESYAGVMPSFAGLELPKKCVFSGAIIKDISSHLILPKIQDDRRKNVLVIRNPLSVAISKEGYGKWNTERDINNFLKQSPALQSLGSQCISRYSVNTKFLEYVFTWCLLHRYILPIIEELGFFVIFYENLLRDPEQSFEELFCFIGHRKRYKRGRNEVMEQVSKRSKTATNDNRIKTNLVDDQPWFRYKSGREISQAHSILKMFDLYDLYRDSIMPKVSTTELEIIVNRWHYAEAHANL